MNVLKNIFVVIVIAAIVFLSYLFITYEIKKNANSPHGSDPLADRLTALCYIWNTKAGDSASLRMNFNGSNITSGFFNYAPANKDSKKGSITGTVGLFDGPVTLRTADLLWIASGEGVTNAERLAVEFDSNTAKPGFGPMKLQGDVYVYSGTVTYDITLQKTDCSDPAIKQ